MMRKLCLLTVLSLVVVPAYAADTTVTQSHTTFDNDELSVKAGDTVIFANKDDVTHNIQVTDSSGSNEDKGLQKPGENIKETFAKPGEYKIHCAIHPKMKMKITVQ
jgi:plastocyanin